MVYWSFVVLGCLGFPVKCAEAGWLLEVSAHRIFLYSSYFGYAYDYFACSKRIIWQARCIMHALWNPWGHFDTLGTRCVTMGTAGRTRGCPEVAFADLGIISGPHFDSFFW